MSKLSKINHDSELYVIDCGDGYSCLGFKVCEERSRKYAEWLGEEYGEPPVGTEVAYTYYLQLLSRVHARWKKTGERCPVGLCDQLIGLEGKRVEVEDCYGQVRRFWVGKSTGHIPIHLEIARVDSTGGPAVTGTPFKSVTVVRERMYA